MQRWLRSPSAGRDVLGEYRDRIMLPMAAASVLLLLPFIVVDGLSGKWLMSGMAFAVMLPLAIDAFALWRKRRPPVAYGWMLAPIALAIGTVLTEHGVYGAMWCYPAILFCYFVLPG
jgi:diguanylate cyclase